MELFGVNKYFILNYSKTVYNVDKSSRLTIVIPEKIHPFV